MVRQFHVPGGGKPRILTLQEDPTGQRGDTRPETNSNFAPWKQTGPPKGNFVFQPSIFRGKLLVAGAFFSWETKILEVSSHNLTNTYKVDPIKTVVSRGPITPLIGVITTVIYNIYNAIFFGSQKIPLVGG